MPVTVACVVCGSPFTVTPSRAESARCCSAECQHIRGGSSRPFVKKVERICLECGGVFLISPSKAREAERAGGMKGQFCSRSCASRHHGHSEAAKRHMRRIRQGQVITPAMLEALRAGRTWAKGQTKASHPSIARRARTLSRLYTGTANPAHGERMRRYYAEHPERHPNVLMTRRGFISRPERMMRTALANAEIPARWQHRIGRYFADFAILHARVVVEVDGLYWHDAARDAVRDEFMIQRGWTVLRFTDKQVLSDLPACIAVICDEIQHPNPPVPVVQLEMPGLLPPKLEPHTA